MPKRVLIAYGSRFGCTGEISEEIANILRRAGLEIQVIDLGHTKLDNWPDIEDFDGIIVGSSIKVNHWKKEAESFLKLSNYEIKSKRKFLALFVCSGNAIHDPKKAKKQYIEEFMENNKLKADLYEIFPGVFDFSTDSRLNFLDRQVLTHTAENIQKETGIHFKFNEKNDMRDWESIRNFADRFIKRINQ